MAEERQTTARVINDLIATCHDAEEGYAKAAKGVHDHALSERLTAISGERGKFAEELRKVVSELGEPASSDAHFGGILHRGWVDLEARIRPKSVPEILANCRDGDQETLKHYEHALGAQLPDEIRALVAQQRDAVERDLASLDQHRSQNAHA
jgi:uncharacterized protein (TIGR02284 family)